MKDYMPNEKMDIRDILDNLADYTPKRRAWTWRTPVTNLETGCQT